MSDLFTRFAGLLKELDEVVPLDQPVRIAQLIPLIKKHANLNTVKLVGVTTKRVGGIHGGHSSGRALVIYQRCELHPDIGQSDQRCPGCQAARYDIAKELAHSLDGEHERTSPDASADKLLAQVIKQAWDGPQATADGLGGMCSLELLVRFRARISLAGTSSTNPSLRLVMALANDNYSELAAQFAVPPHLLKHAFSEPYTNAIRRWRLAFGLSVEPGGWD